MTDLLHKLYAIMDKGPLRALSLVLALVLAGCVFWQPRVFAANTGTLQIWQSLLLVWAVSAGVVYGVGFKPNHVLWQTVFSPLPAMLILMAGLFYFWFVV